MLGEKIGEENGKVTGRRILPGDDFRYVKMEISFEAQGTVYGTPYTQIGTYTVFERIPGQVYGEGQGIIMTQDGQGAIWKGHGVGHMEGSTMKIAASVAYQAGEGSLARLNGCLCVVEHTAEMEGAVHSVVWEWKA